MIEGKVGSLMPAKLSKDKVNYRPAKKERRCGNCTAFLPQQGSCTRIEGRIEPFMVCDRWTPLKGSEGVRLDGG